MIEEFLPEDNTEVYYVLSSGKKSSEETELSCAKTIVGDSMAFFIKFHRGKLFDPHGLDKNKVRNAQYRKVDATTFDLYLSYLKSRRGDLLLRAERRCIDV